METLERKLVLLSWLRSNGETYTMADLSADGYNGETIEVNPHRVYYGTGPAEATKTVAWVKETLKIVFGDQVDEWTLGFLFQQHAVYLSLAAEVKKAKEAMNTAGDWVGEVSDEHIRYMDNADKPMYLWASRYIKTREPKRKALKEAITRFTNTRQWSLDIFKEARDVHKLSFEPFTRTLPKLQEWEKLTQLYEEKKAELAKIVTYDSVVATLRADERVSDRFKVGIHDLVNTIYHIFPHVHHNEGKPEPHMLTYREAWEGVTIKDRRTKGMVCDSEYIVYDDDEADKAWDDELDNYLDECVLPEMDSTASQFFDRDAWKEFAKQDGRGHSLGRYDGEEHSHIMSWEDFVALVMDEGNEDILDEDTLEEIFGTSDRDECKKLVKSTNWGPDAPIELDKIEAVIYRSN